MKPIYLFPLMLSLVICCNNTNNKPNTNKDAKHDTSIKINAIDSQKVISKENLDRKNILSVERVKKDSATQKYISKWVDNVKEVRELRKKFKDKLMYLIDDYPTDSSPYYVVQICLDDGTRYVPVYNFYIESNSHRIKILDTVNDTIVPIEYWRRNNK